MRGTQAGRCKTGAGRLRPKRGKAQTRRRSRCGAAAELTRVVCGHILPFGGRCGWQLAEPLGSRWGAVGEPLGSRWEAVGKPLGSRWGWAFWAVRGRSGAFGGDRGRGRWPVGGVRGRSGPGPLASRGQSGALRQTSDVGHERWGQLRQTSDVRRHKTPWAGLGGAKVAAWSARREDGRQRRRRERA